MSIIKVLKVQSIGNYHLLVTFSNEEKRIFDGSHLLSKPVFSPLIDQELFNNVYCEFGGLIWSDDIDLSAEYVYQKSTLVE